MSTTPKALTEVQVTVLDRLQKELARGNLALELLRVAYRMRSAQRDYFKDRAPQKLATSKQLEKLFDAGLEDLAQQLRRPL